MNILKLSLPVNETNEEEVNKETKSVHIEWIPNSPWCKFVPIHGSPDCLQISYFWRSLGLIIFLGYFSWLTGKIPEEILKCN